MSHIDNFAGVPLSQFTNGARLVIGACLLLLAPVLVASPWS